MRLRMDRLERPLHVILVNPEIPQNTGNIARLCAATGSSVHLVGDLGFSTDEKAVRRAGLDYWHLVKVHEHDDLQRCLQSIEQPTPLLFSTGASESYVDAPYLPGSALVFGAESVGLSDEILSRYQKTTYGIPTCSGTVRSLNLGNTAAIVVYRALEKIGAIECARLEP